MKKRLHDLLCYARTCDGCSVLCPTIIGTVLKHFSAADSRNVIILVFVQYSSHLHEFRENQSTSVMSPVAAARGALP